MRGQNENRERHFGAYSGEALFSSPHAFFKAKSISPLAWLFQESPGSAVVFVLAVMTIWTLGNSRKLDLRLLFGINGASYNLTDVKLFLEISASHWSGSWTVSLWVRPREGKDGNKMKWVHVLFFLKRTEKEYRRSGESNLGEPAHSSVCCRLLLVFAARVSR